jgi:Flp pilus assembly pilin Flp
MRNLFVKMWKDDAGIVAFEYLLVATIVGLGLVVGLSAVSAGLNAELTELANAILTLNQSYSVVTQSNCQATKIGMGASETPQLLTYNTAAPVITPIGINPCP